jgi:hypothetical protein
MTNRSNVLRNVLSIFQETGTYSWMRVSGSVLLLMSIYSGVQAIEKESPIATELAMFYAVVAIGGKAVQKFGEKKP